MFYKVVDYIYVNTRHVVALCFRYEKKICRVNEVKRLIYDMCVNVRLIFNIKEKHIKKYRVYSFLSSSSHIFNIVSNVYTNNLLG